MVESDLLDRERDRDGRLDPLRLGHCLSVLSLEQVALRNRDSHGSHGRDPRAEYSAAHIPGAVFFDIDDISDETNPYPHMIPSATKFSARMRRLGLGGSSSRSFL